MTTESSVISPATGLTPQQKYEHELAAGILQPDKHQQKAVAALEQLHHTLKSRQKPRLWPFFRKQTAIPGVYLYGPVGRGKTHLMDLFYDTLTGSRRQRWHYHDFMQWLHGHLRQQKQRQNPLARVVEELGKKINVLCLDEFLVNDIADAMLLAGLLSQLQTNGITLVTTSNVAPDDLYADGLQRSRFLPAIDWLKKNMQVIHLQGNTDFRFRHSETTPETHAIDQKWFFPADDNARRCLKNCFASTGGQWPKKPPPPVQLNGRWLPILACSDKALWTSFQALCGENRHSHDYLELASRFQTLLLSHIPVLDDNHNDAARRFITLVDVLYDRSMPLFASAEDHYSRIYQGTRLAFEFQRTVSRLHEMQHLQLQV